MMHTLLLVAQCHATCVEDIGVQEEKQGEHAHGKDMRDTHTTHTSSSAAVKRQPQTPTIRTSHNHTYATPHVHTHSYRTTNTRTNTRTNTPILPHHTCHVHLPRTPRTYLSSSACLHAGEGSCLGSVRTLADVVPIPAVGGLPHA